MRPILTALTAILLLLPARPHAQSVLRIGLNDDPDALDPTISRAYTGRLVFAALCDKLFDVTPDLKIVPQLATGYEWARGPQVDRDQAAPGREVPGRRAVQRGGGASSTSSGTRTRRARSARPEIGEIQSVDVVNDLTVRFNLSQPLVPLLAALTDRAGMMVSPKAARGARRQARHPAGVRRALQVRRARGPGQDRRSSAFADYWDKAQHPRRPHRVRADHRLDRAPGQPALRRSADDRARLAHRPARRSAATPSSRWSACPSSGYQMIPLNVANGPKGKALGRRAACARPSTSRSTARRSSRPCSTASTSRATSSSARRAPTTTRRSRWASATWPRPGSSCSEAGQPNLDLHPDRAARARPAGGGADHPGHAGRGRHHDEHPDAGERHDAARPGARATSRPTSRSGAAGPTPTATSSPTRRARAPRTTATTATPTWTRCSPRRARSRTPPSARSSTTRRPRSCCATCRG